MATDFKDGFLIFTTTPKREEALKLAKGLVENRLAACVNVLGPIKSYYFWQGSIVEDEEFKVFIKTSPAKKEGVVHFIKQNHSYQVPEITCTPVTYENPDYAHWLYDYLS